MNSLCVIGAGKWGEALWSALKIKTPLAKMTSRTPREHVAFVSLSEALLCEYLVITVPSQAIRIWLKENFVFSGQKVLVAAKGIEAQSGAMLNEIYAPYVPSSHLAFLSGPSFASEVQQQLPSAVVINSLDEALALSWKELFPSFMKTYTSTDVIGAEIAGAYKNVLAIAGGICEGLSLGNNAKAALITRGLAEMTRFGLSHGAKLETFLGLSGVGDLFLTASSPLSRNFRVGLGLAKGKKLAMILDELGEVAEGVPTAYAICQLAQSKQEYTPIAKEVCAIFEGKNPYESLKDLLGTSRKSEF